eukprot:353066-Chlamydomonas_euryale.AAC.1
MRHKHSSRQKCVTSTCRRNMRHKNSSRQHAAQALVAAKMRHKHSSLQKCGTSARRCKNAAQALVAAKMRHKHSSLQKCITSARCGKNAAQTLVAAKMRHKRSSLQTCATSSGQGKMHVHVVRSSFHPTHAHREHAILLSPTHTWHPTMSAPQAPPPPPPRHHIPSAPPSSLLNCPQARMHAVPRTMRASSGMPSDLPPLLPTQLPRRHACMRILCASHHARVVRDIARICRRGRRNLRAQPRAQHQALRQALQQRAVPAQQLPGGSSAGAAAMADAVVAARSIAATCVAALLIVRRGGGSGGGATVGGGGHSPAAGVIRDGCIPQCWQVRAAEKVCSLKRDGVVGTAHMLRQLASQLEKQRGGAVCRRTFAAAATVCQRRWQQRRRRCRCDSGAAQHDRCDGVCRAALHVAVEPNRRRC